ncbi:proteasome activator complex subunit 3-like isoform X2 [Oppia nitens]|uniref:proteasome activator complex subunit 3-like isoform X2 n=1 Tax=Oppia nitens TaxID=1686743 RepID=UPI0023DBA16D|nr:proteasome activator complex subunit 3-like isoform X2 [Oppia nitens]
MANDVNKEVHEFKEQIKKEAETLVLKTFPRKILELQALLNSAKFTIEKLSDICTDINIPVPTPTDSINNHKDHSDGDLPSKKRKYEAIDCDGISGTKVLVLPNGMAPCNKHVVQLIELVKPLIRQLVEDANLLKMWILFLIPRIEDGNNFGVSIQEDTLGEIRTVEGEAAAYFDQMSRYFLSRAKTVAKVAKYPHVDYRRTIQEIDEKEFLSLRLVVAELRNHYATLHDMVTKNLDKIKTPRTSNAENMY